MDVQIRLQSLHQDRTTMSQQYNITHSIKSNTTDYIETHWITVEWFQ